MKKIGVMIVFFLLVSSALAQNESTNETINKLSEKVDGLDKYIEKQVPLISSLPPRLQTVLKYTLGLTGESSISLAIIMITLWVILAIGLVNILSIFSIFSKGTSTAIGILLSIIFAATGVLKNISISLMNLAANLRFLEDWSAGVLGFVIVILVLIFFFVSKLSNEIRRHNIIEEAEESGIKKASVFAIMQSFVKSLAKFTKDTD